MEHPVPLVSQDHKGLELGEAPCGDGAGQKGRPLQYPLPVGGSESPRSSSFAGQVRAAPDTRSALANTPNDNVRGARPATRMVFLSRLWQNLTPALAAFGEWGP